MMTLLRKMKTPLAAIGSVAALAVLVAATPSTPQKPGRATPTEAGTLPPLPTSQPAEASAPGTDQNTPTDEELLQETASDLGIKNPEDRPGVQILHWFGLRPKVEEHGITFVGAITADYSKNLQNGISTASDAFRHLLDLRVNLDSRSLLGFAGGTFSVDFQNQDGENGSDRLVGDVQGFDNADSDGRTEISELWYQQLLFNQQVRVKIGKVDANTEFAAPANGSGFLNSSFGYSPTIFLLPTYPDPAMSANVFVYPSPWVYAGAGVYDGSGAVGVNTGDYGPRHFFNGDGDYFYIGEAGVKWAPAFQTLPGRFAAGGWYSSADVPRFDGQTSAGTGGVYAILEQTLWHERYYLPTDPVGISAFLQYGYADPHVSQVTEHVGGGVVWTGPLPVHARENDALGVGFTYAGLATAPAAGFSKRYELSIESYYGIQLTDYLVLKPDLQYIINPGGNAVHDALVATVRATLAF